MQKELLIESSVETGCRGIPVQRRRPMGVFKLAVPAMVLALVCLIPYLNKAYTIDDPWFLLEARQILKTPLQPLSYSVCWMGNETCLLRASNLGSRMAQAFMGYLLVPVVLAGGAEWIAHLLQVLLVCLAVLEMVRLALRLGLDRVQASIAGLMLVAIPPVLSMASTAMPDIAALALGLTGIERLLAWKDGRRWHQAIIAGLTLGFAPFTRPHLVLLLPLGALWLFQGFDLRRALRQVRNEAYLWMPVLAATCLLATLNLLTRDRGPVPEAPATLTGLNQAPRNLESCLQYLVYPIPFGAVWLGVRWRRSPILLIGPAIPSLLHHFMLNPSGSLVQEWPIAASFYGLVALAHMLSHYWSRPDWSNRMLSLWVLFPLPVIIYTHLPMKYFVGVMPAIVVILIQTLSDLPRPRANVACGVLILVCASFSWVLLRADYDFAEYGRRAAAELIAPRVAAGEKVWYGAGQWGFYWYAQEAGAKVSKPGEPGPNRGELLVVGLVEGGGTTLKRFPHRELVESRHYNSPHGRTVGYGGALYSNSCGDAPWVWNPETTNDYEVWRIR
jgi:hypothetical protein